MLNIRNKSQFNKYLIDHFSYETSETCMGHDRYVKNPNRRPKLRESMDEFNMLYQTCRKLKLFKLVRSKSGAIKKNPNHFMGAYDVQVIKNSQNNVFKGIILTITIMYNTFVFKYGYLKASENTNMTGIKAFEKFKTICKKEGIDLSKYEIDSTQGWKEKAKIESPLIECRIVNEELENVHHLDLNSAWPSALCRAYPELLPVFEQMDKDSKNCTIGFFQSKYCNYKYAHLAKVAINDTNKEMYRILRNMHKQNFLVIACNTDGIWYKDKTDQNRLYHDDFEGKGLSKWKHDYTNCRFYAYNYKGIYYFYTPDGKFNVRARGYYSYEAIKPREEWNQEDFFKAVTSRVDIGFDEEGGLFEYE